MQVIRTIEELKAKIDACNDRLANDSDDAMRALFSTFQFDFSADAPSDPFGPAYHAFQMRLYRTVADKPYAVSNERTLFAVEEYETRPFPYYLGSTATAGNHLLAVAFLLRSMELRPGARVLEFGPGWGNTTLALAQLGMRVTAVDVEPNFCEVIRRRAARHGVEIEVVEGDFFWAEQVSEPYDAALFFECFHHCDDHMRLLRALRRAVKPDGRVYFAAEPILPDYAVPWGVRTDGEALWAIRNFGWLELGFREGYFHAALARTGWQAEKRTSVDVDWISLWIARRAPVDEAATEQRAAPHDGSPQDTALQGEGQVSASAEVPPTETATRPAEPVGAGLGWRLALASALASTIPPRLAAPLRAAVRYVLR